MVTEKEIRSFGEQAVPKIIKDKRIISGYAIVFNQKSQLMYSRRSGGLFEEIILPTAVSEDLLKNSDVKALIEHNRERLLARANKGVGTLKLEIDNIGLKYEFQIPNTTEGRDIAEMITRGDIAGSSFAFTTKYEDTEYVERKWDGERKLWICQVKKIESLYDISITADPAYLETSVDTRSFANTQKNKHLYTIEEYKKRIDKNF